MLHLIHSGHFYSRENAKWDIQILREQAQEPDRVGELAFPADEPLVIEWEERSKEEVVCGSSAELRLISPADRTYLDLYSERVGAVVLVVYKNGSKYWTGCLDTEFYEEPFTWREDYEVSLTFSDFGQLSIVKFAEQGWLTIREIIYKCVAACNLHTNRDESYISTLLDDGTPLTLDRLSVHSDNFYDEDGEPMSLLDVLEGVLQPLALRIIQRGGRIYVYDLNALRAGIKYPEKIEWMSDDQMLAVDTVYSNIKVTYSPYQRSGVLSPQECFTEETDSNVTALDKQNGLTHGNCQVFTYHATQDPDSESWGNDHTDIGFSLWTTTNGENAEILVYDGRFFKIIPHADGQEAEGIAIFWPGVWQWSSQNGKALNVDIKGSEIARYVPGYGVGRPLFRSSKVALPPVDNTGSLRLRISLEMLLDCRLNPFEQAADVFRFETKETEKKWKEDMNFVYVPVSIKFQPEGSEQIYVWNNNQLGENQPLVVCLNVNDNPVKTLDASLGQWYEYNADDMNPHQYAFLAYYIPDDRSSDCGVLGWKKNRQAINPHTEPLTTSLADAPEGQVIPYPNVGGKGGKLWIEVRQGSWFFQKGGETLDWSKISDEDNDLLAHGGLSTLRWLLFKLPEISIEKAQQYDAEIPTDDIEYNSQANPDAKEELAIDTVCGTAATPQPTARGAFFRSDSFKQVNLLTRAGQTSQAEDLLIATLYSQFAERRIKLSGTVALPQPTLTLYREAVLPPSTLFLMTSCIEDLQQELAEASFVEIKPDYYERQQ